MAGAVCAEGSLAAKLAAVLRHLDERQRRLVMGAEARVLGHGGIKVIAHAAGVSAVTVSKGVAELEAGEEPLGRTRRKGGGRKSVNETDPAVRTSLLSLVDPTSRGDPESPPTADAPGGVRRVRTRCSTHDPPQTPPQRHVRRS